jgi:hypothetical protein
VQKPHWSASCRTNASWIGSSSSPSASPSTVVTSAFCASTASIMHDATSRPFTITEQPPHAPRSQTSLAPVRPCSMRSVSSSVVAGSTVAWSNLPLTRRLTSTGPGPMIGIASRAFASDCASALSAIAPAAAERPTVWMNARRETS